MQNKPVALVTGTNKGIGLQIAQDLASHGLIVLVGSRNLERGEDADNTSGRVATRLASTSRNRHGKIVIPLRPESLVRKH